MKFRIYKKKGRKKIFQFKCKAKIEYLVQKF